MNFKILFLSCFCFLVSCQKNDDTSSGEIPAPVLGSALFTVVNCTDTTNDPTCSISFEVLASSRIFLYTSAVNRELNNPIFSQTLTNGSGIADISGLEGQTYFYTVEYPLAPTIIQQDDFKIVNGSRAQIRIEFTEE